MIFVSPVRVTTGRSAYLPISAPYLFLLLFISNNMSDTIIIKINISDYIYISYIILSIESKERF